MEQMKQPQDGHRERLRSRYWYAGENGLPDYDMLELLLTYAIQRRDVKPIARDLLEKFHDLYGVLDAEAEELVKIDGIGRNSALLVTLVRTLCTRYLENKVKGKSVLLNSDAVQSYVRARLAVFTREAFLAVFLNVKNQILDTKIFASGTVDTIILHPKMIAEEALARKASGLIVGHNHPSGSVEPSVSDLTFTRNLQRALSLLEIRLLDHLVVSREAVYSFRDHNQLEMRNDCWTRK